MDKGNRTGGLKRALRVASATCTLASLAIRLVLEVQKGYMAYTKKDNYVTVPTRAHEKDAGLDLYADMSVDLEPGAHALVGTGVNVAIPVGHVGLVCPRSGLAANKGVTVLNAPGIVDAGYTGEVKVNLYNSGQNACTIRMSDKIAQLVIVPIITPKLVQVAELSKTKRGNNGHGSTGR